MSRRLQSAFCHDGSRFFQLCLSLRVGVSQRHLSCIETGKAIPSREMLLALLDGLDTLQARPNLLLVMTASDGLASRLINRSEVLGEVLRRAQREAAHVPALQAIVDQIPQSLMGGCSFVQANDSPTLLTRFSSSVGKLSFMLTFTSFGAPLDVTVASLRIEHLFAVDDVTRKALAGV